MIPFKSRTHQKSETKDRGAASGWGCPKVKLYWSLLQSWKGLQVGPFGSNAGGVKGGLLRGWRIHGELFLFAIVHIVERIFKVGL
jgi:hypothetical protein